MIRGSDAVPFEAAIGIAVFDATGVRPASRSASKPRWRLEASGASRTDGIVRVSQGLTSQRTTL
jgi:hypothetical protein